MYGYGMHDYGWGFGALFMWAIPLLVLVGLVVLVVKLLGGKGPRSAREILDESYTRGEIDREEYLRKREDLER
jgi:putative membrane protein